MNKINIVFMGTADFSKAVLIKLIKAGYNISAVVTQPDRLVGRKKVLMESLVKKLALQHDIPIIQPANIKKDYQAVLDFKPDLIITAAYGQIVPEAILEAPRLGCINVHASLLPKLRGGAPVHYAIINGLKETGISIMYMAKKMDAGDVITQSKIMIESNETVGTLYTKLTILGADLLIQVLPDILNGTNSRTPQNESEVTFAPTIKRADEKINWNQNAQVIDCFIRGLNPSPVAYTTYLGSDIKIYAGLIHDCPNANVHHRDAECGEIVKIFNETIAIKVVDGIYLINEIQVSGKKKMFIKDLLRGNLEYFKVGNKLE